MPPTIGGVTIDPQGQTLTVTVTPSAKVYTDQAGTSLAVFPATVTSRTSYWMSAAQQFTVSVKTPQGVEIADGVGNPLVLDIQQGVMEGIAPVVDRPGPEDQAQSGTYASAAGNNVFTGNNRFSAPFSFGPDPTGQSGFGLQLLVKDDTMPWSAFPAQAVFELEHNGSIGNIYHLTSGPTAATDTPALIALGVDSGRTGLYVHNRADFGGGVGIKISMDPGITNVNNHGLRVNQVNVPAPAAWFGSGAAGGAEVARFCANVVPAAGQKIVTWYTSILTSSDTLIGYVAADTGHFVWQTQASFQPTDVNTTPLLVVGLTGQVADLQQWSVVGGGTPAKISGSGALTSTNVTANGVIRANAAGATLTLNDTSQTTDNQIIRWSNSSGSLLATRRATSGEANLGTYFQFSGSGTQTLPDAANQAFGTTTGTKHGTAANQKQSFFGATPIVQPTGTPAAATDLATALTLVNSLRTNLLALGLVA